MLDRSLVLAASLGLVATPALSANLAVESLLTLCAPHHGEAKAVFAAAEADGWTMRPGCTLPRTDDAKVGELLDAFGMTPCSLWRTKTVGGRVLQLLVTEEEADWEDGRHRIRRCAILEAAASMDRLEADATAALGVPPQPRQGPIISWIWTEDPKGRTFLPPATEASLAEAASREPVYAVRIDPTEPSLTLTYSEVVRTGAPKP